MGMPCHFQHRGWAYVAALIPITANTTAVTCADSSIVICTDPANINALGEVEAWHTVLKAMNGWPRSEGVARYGALAIGNLSCGHAGNIDKMGALEIWVPVLRALGDFSQCEEVIIFQRY